MESGALCVQMQLCNNTRALAGAPGFHCIASGLRVWKILDYEIWSVREPTPLGPTHNLDEKH